MTQEFYSMAKELEEKEAKGKITMVKNEEKVKGEVIPFTGVTAPKYQYKGVLNKTVFPEFIKLCKLSEKKLKQFLCREMKTVYKENCFIGDGYIYCKGEIPVLLTAHMDTVHKELIRTYYEELTTDKNGNTEHIISSPQGIGGDDRCGVYIILEILKKGYLPYILFCEEEETGGKGSAKFCKTKYIEELKSLKFLLELDRANSCDLVFYDNGNVDWMDWVEDETNWTSAWGSFSDICHLSPACGVSSVNLSCGYYKQHTLNEYVVIEEMLETINITEHLLLASEEVEQFEYKEKKKSWESYGYYGYYGYYGNGDKYKSDYTYNSYDYDDEYYYRKINSAKIVEDEKKETKYELEINFVNEEGEEEYLSIKGDSEGECWMAFFLSYPYVCFYDVLDYLLVPIY